MSEPKCERAAIHNYWVSRNWPCPACRRIELESNMVNQEQNAVSKLFTIRTAIAELLDKPFYEMSESERLRLIREIIK